jgi:isocitrate dehydrogenase
MMLDHLGLPDCGEIVKQAISDTLESGTTMADIEASTVY